MLLPVSITSDGETVAYRSFEVAAEKGADMSAPLTVIGERLLQHVRAQYESEGAWAHTPWAPLTPEYGAWKESHVPGTPMLVGLVPLHKGTREHPTRPETYAPSGRMRRALLDPLAVHVRPTFMLYEPQSPIARYHQAGTTKMVARPPVVLTLGFLSEVGRSFAAWLDDLSAAMVST